VVKGAALAHLLQGERHMIEIRPVAADAREVEEEIIGFRMQKFRLRAVAAVHMVSEPFQHARNLGHNRGTQRCRCRVGFALLGFHTVAGRGLQNRGFITLIGIHQPD
jgi:hypothetical protein